MCLKHGTRDVHFMGKPLNMPRMSCIVMVIRNDSNRHYLNFLMSTSSPSQPDNNFKPLESVQNISQPSEIRFSDKLCLTIINKLKALSPSKKKHHFGVDVDSMIVDTMTSIRRISQSCVLHEKSNYFISIL